MEGHLAAGVSYLGLVGLLAQQHVLGHEFMEEQPYVMALPWAATRTT